MTAHVIAVGLNDDASPQLDEMASAVRGRRWLVDSEQQLNEVLGYLIDLEPVIPSADRIAEIGSGVVDLSNEVVDAANACDATTAREAAVRARKALSDANLPWRTSRVATRARSMSASTQLAPRGWRV